MLKTAEEGEGVGVAEGVRDRERRYLAMKGEVIGGGRRR